MVSGVGIQDHLWPGKRHAKWVMHRYLRYLSGSARLKRLPNEYNWSSINWLFFHRHVLKLVVPIRPANLKIIGH